MAADGTTPGEARDPIGGLVGQFEEAIKGHFELDLTDRTRTTLRHLLARVGSANRGDFVSAVFLECLTTAGPGELTDDGVRLAADRVRQRIVREARRAVTTGAVAETPAPQLPPDDEAELVIREFQSLLRNRDPLDAVLFQRYYLADTRNVPQLAADLGLSPATVYRRLKSLRDDFLALRDVRQPPHAAD